MDNRSIRIQQFQFLVYLWWIASTATGRWRTGRHGGSTSRHPTGQKLRTWYSIILRRHCSCGHVPAILRHRSGIAGSSWNIRHTWCRSETSCCQTGKHCPCVRVVWYCSSTSSTCRVRHLASILCHRWTPIWSFLVLTRWVEFILILTRRIVLVWVLTRRATGGTVMIAETRRCMIRLLIGSTLLVIMSTIRRFEISTALLRFKFCCIRTERTTSTTIATTSTVRCMVGF